MTGPVTKYRPHDGGSMLIDIINGPNLNLLGSRESGVYGETTLGQMNEELRLYAAAMPAKLKLRLNFFQKNGEGEIIDCLHKSKADYIILNAGAYTHYSYAVADAVKAIKVPVIDVHLSNIYAREEFRKTNLTAPVCIGSVCGFGVEGYKAAINLAALKGSESV
jgi:3-dehydroquinate dehydratase-2